MEFARIIRMRMWLGRKYIVPYRLIYRVGFLLCITILTPGILHAQDTAKLYLAGDHHAKIFPGYKSVNYSEDSLTIVTTRGKSHVYGTEQADSLIMPRAEIIKILISRKGKKSEAFIQPLIKGRINLYTGFYQNHKVFYLEKDKGGVYYIPHAHYLNYIYLFFHDCKALDISEPFKNPERFTYTTTGWLQLVSVYNNCNTGSSQPVQYFRKPPFTYDRAVFAGLSMSKVNMNTRPYKQHDLGTGFSPYIGLLFGVLYHERIGLYSGLAYENMNNFSHFSAIGFRFDDNLEIIRVNVDIKLDYRLNILQLPLILRFVPFDNGKLKVYGDAGALVNILLVSNSIVTANDDYKPGVDYRYNIEFNRFSPGLYGAVGLSFPLLTREGEVRFNMKNAWYDIDPITSYLYTRRNARTLFTSFTLSAGIHF